MSIDFRCGDNLTEIKKIPKNSIDFIYFDPPFGITECEYDKSLNWEPLWKEMWRVLKKPGVVAIHSSQPFTAKLINTQFKKYKYNWYWDKKNKTGFLFSKFQPLRHIEEICIFYKNGKYNPQMKKREKPLKIKKDEMKSDYYVRAKPVSGTYTHNFPNHLIEMPRITHKYSTRPVKLCEYFIQTYSNEGETVLDLTCSNGQSAIACHNLNRNYIGIDIDLKMIADAKTNFLNNTVI